MLAHKIDDDSRTKDVVVLENVTFDSLLLSEKVSKGLTKHGFKKPSPIQLKSIPLGRCGFDLIVKSKSGTGKTLVFSLIALETLNSKLKNLEVLILSPTREIAVQSHDVIKQIGCFFDGLNVESFIGGLPVAEDKEKCQRCNIAVGTPGRIKHLILEKSLNVSTVKLFVLDEADKLMESSFRNEINEIYNSLPTKKQIITTSATYPNQLEDFLSNYMLSPTHITAEFESPLLLGLKQFVVVTDHYSSTAQQIKAKTDELVNILANISFTQCLIFSNFQSKAASLSNVLNMKGWSSTYISAAQTQEQRLEAVNVLKDFKCRIMISTDLTARGIDAANVDLVINYDIPVDAMTYLHRMGRAGRYGSSGVCVNLASQGTELTHLQEILGRIGGNGLTIPKLPTMNGTISDLLKCEIPIEDHIPSKLNSKLEKSVFTSKMYENKSEKKSKSRKKLHKKAKISSSGDDNEHKTSEIIDDKGATTSKIAEKEGISKRLDGSEAKPSKNLDDMEVETSKHAESTDLLSNTQNAIKEARIHIPDKGIESVGDLSLDQSLSLEDDKEVKFSTNVGDLVAGTSKHVEPTGIQDNTQNEIDKVRRHTSNMDTESILDSLLNQNFKFENDDNEAKTSKATIIDLEAQISKPVELTDTPANDQNEMDKVRQHIANMDTESILNSLLNQNFKLENDNKKARTSENVNNMEAETSKRIEQTDILNNTQNEVDEVRRKISNMDTESILDSLLKQNCNFEIDQTNCVETNVNKQIDAQVVFDLVKRGCSQTSKTESSISNQKSLTTVETEEDRHEKTLAKNKALLSVSQLLSNSSGSEESVCIQQHLQALKSQVKRKVRHLSKKSVSDLMTVIKTDDYKNDSNPCRSETEPAAENLFQFAYKRFVLSDDSDWEETLKEKYVTTTAQSPISKKCVQTVSDRETKYRKRENPSECAELSQASQPKIWSSNPEENLMLETEWHQQETGMKWMPVEEEYYEEECSEEPEMMVCDDEYELRRQEEAMKWTEVEPTQTADSVTPTCVLELRNNSDESEYEHFSGYLDPVDDRLWNNGMDFDDSESFNDWFTFEWEVELQAARGYVEQNIYLNEMSKLQNSSYYNYNH